MIGKIDIGQVAESIGVELSDTDMNWVLECYRDAQRQDPSGTWNLVVEDLIHQLVEMRDDSEERRDFGNDDEPENLTIRITGGGTRKDISLALSHISKAILTTPIEDLDGCEWEDCTLMTEVNVDDANVCDGCGEEVDESHLYCPNCGDENF